MVSHILTTDGVTVVVRNRPYNISRGHPDYKRLVDLIDRGAPEGDFEFALTELSSKIQAAVRQLITSDIVYDSGVILHQGKELTGYVIDKLIEIVHAGKDARPLALFVEKLQQNPSHQTIEHLYAFLEYGRIPITMNGDFLAYKAIRKNWMDIHSGTMDNSIGRVVKMPRNKVDDRRDVTCSNGLHVCSFEYLPGFAHADGHVVLCQVNPKDVVAIPSDYNNTKMRVSEYLVVGEVEGYYEEHRDVLRGQSVWEPRFTVFVRDNDTDEWQEHSDADDFGSAIEIAKELAGDDPEQQWSEVKVMDQETGTKVFHRAT